MVEPESVASSVNFAVPEAPVVDAGFPLHFVIAPAIPPQIARVATFMSCVSMLLGGKVSFFDFGRRGVGIRKGTYSVLSVHVVPETAAGFTLVLARILRISTVEGFTETAETVAEIARRRARKDVGLYMTTFVVVFYWYLGKLKKV